MRYKFELEKNVFMYNHLLVVTNGQKRYKAIIEDSAIEKRQCLFG